MSSSKFVKYSLTLLIINLFLREPIFKSHIRFWPSTAFAGSSNTKQGTDSIPLPSPGKSTTRELSTSEIHSYQVTLDTNQYFRAVVEQHGTEVSVTLNGPGGQTLVQLDCRYYGLTPVSLISETSGVYRLEVRSLERDQRRGRYELRVEQIRPATSIDNYRIAAEKTFAEAEQLLKEWRAESSRRAIDKFKASLPSWRAVGDYSEEALTLKRIGDVYQPLGEYESALTFYNRALSLSRAVKDRRSEAEALNEIGYVYVSLGDNQKALKYCTKALKSSREAHNRRGEAKALNNLGEVYNWSGKLQKALESYRHALSLWITLGDIRGQALSHTYLGYIYSDLGQVREAFSSYNQALSFWQSVLDQRGQTITLTAIGRLYSRMGESQAALDFFEQAMRLIQPIGDPFGEASILNGVAYVLDGLGEKQRALEYYKQALRLFQATGHRSAEATTLGDAGRVYFSLGDNQNALEHLQHSLLIFKAVGDHRMEIAQLKEIGKVYDAWNDNNKALEFYLRARASYRAERDLRGEAVTLNLIGRVYEEWGRKQKAFEYYERALQYSRKANYRVAEAATLHNIARVERDRGNLVTARARAEEALGVVESLRGKVNSQDLRTSYFASVRQQYEFYIDLLMLLHCERPGEGFQGAAFEASERSRARSLLETLASARVGVRQKADPTLLEQESKLSHELNVRAARRMRLQPGSGRADAEAAILAKEIGELAWQLREIDAQIRVGTMTQTASLEILPLGLEAIQQRVVGDDTLLLEYSLGEERSYLWAISKEAVLSYELPRRAEIETAARDVYDLLTANQPLAGETFEQRQARVVTANEQLPSQIANLSKILLEPVAAELGTKRLLIVADGALQYIPFQILTKPADPNRAGSEISPATAEPRPLFADHEIVNEPSASALALLIGDTTTRKQPPNSVAVFADPVFEVDDPRIKSGSATKTGVMTSELRETELRRALRDVGLTGDGAGIPRLRASRDEADAIMAAAPWGSGFKALGFEASRTTAMRSDLGDYRIVHFATHGFLNDEHPELSGVVLSMFDEQGQAQEGFLRLYDIYNLKLPVDLVVLSACNTGLGKDIRGEGLIGLTRGFMYAGASSVVATLWKVDDEATAELMSHFYRFMLRDGLSPAAALRKAQIEMSQQKRWQSPYYWSGFIIQGQYLPSARVKHFSTTRLALWGGVTAVLVIAVFFVWKRRRTSVL